MRDSRNSNKRDKPYAQSRSTGDVSRKQTQSAAPRKRLRHDPFDDEKTDALFADLKNVPRISFDAQRLIPSRSQPRPSTLADRPTYEQQDEPATRVQQNGQRCTHTSRVQGSPALPSRPDGISAHSNRGWQDAQATGRQSNRVAQQDYTRSYRPMQPVDSMRPTVSLPYRSAATALPAILSNHQLVLLLICTISVVVIIWLWPGSPLPAVSRFMLTKVVPGQAQQNGFGMSGEPRPAGDYTLQGAPSLNARQIDQILAGYNSPASGTGHIWLNLGREYGIDPAFAVAFFILESSAGTHPGWAGLKPDGSTTHNVGNIICAGYATCYKGHRDYPSWDAGIEDWYRLILVEYINGRGLITVDQILLIYCPFSDGCAPDRYAVNVQTMVDQWKRGEIP